MKKNILICLIVISVMAMEITAQSVSIKNVKFTFNEAISQIAENDETGALTFSKDLSSYQSLTRKYPMEENAPFIAVGLTCGMNGIYDYMGVSIRFSADEVNWTNWKPFNIDDDIEQDASKRVSSLIFTDVGNKFYQIKVDAEYFDKLAEGKTINVSFINPGFTDEKILEKAEAIAQQEKTQGDFGLPPVISRTEWGCPDGQSSRWSPSYTNVTHLIVHHSATENVSSDWAAVVRTFWGWHAIDNGWGDIGYNFLIDPNGVVYEGRSGGNNAIGAHFCGTNSNTMGMCVMGTYTSSAPTDKAFSSLAKILTWKCNLENINPLGSAYHSSSGRTLNNISGHRDGCSTECPGTTLYNGLPSVRNDVLNLLGSKGPYVTEPAGNIKYNHPAYKEVTLNFSQSMDKQSVESAFKIEPDDSVRITWISSYQLIIKPENLWSFSTQYNFTIDTSARSIFGSKLDGDNDGQPGGAFNYSVVITDPDFEAPEIINAYPNGNDINIYSEMKLVFNEEVDGIIGRVSLLDGSNKVVSIQDGKIINENDITYITFRPKNALAPMTEYNISVNAGISDYLGNEIKNDSLFTFSTDNGNYPEGNILENFEGEDVIADPASDPQSTGFSPYGTSFKRTGYRSVEGIASGLLTYEFAADTGGVINLWFKSGFPISQTDSIICIWINGDLSDNLVSAVFNGGGISYDFGHINWFGWKIFEINVNRFNTRPEIISGVRLTQSGGANKNGKIYFDKLFISDNKTTSIPEERVQLNSYKLEQNYPNPFNPATEIRYYIPNSGFVTLELFNTLGQKIKTLIHGVQQPGQYSVEINLGGVEKYASGVYFYRLTIRDSDSGKLFSSTKKMILLN